MATVCGGKKHAGKAFEQVLQEDRGYVAWAVGELQARPENTNGWVKDLAEFGVANGVEAKVGNPPMHRLQAAVQPGAHPCTSPSYTPKYPTQPPPLRRGATGAAPPVAQYAIAPDGEAKPPSDVTNGAGKRERDPFMGDPPLTAKVQRNANEPSFACPMVCEMVGGLSPISASANELYASIQRGAPPKERVIDFRAYWSVQVRRAFERHSQSSFRVLDCDLEDRSMPGFDRASHDMRRAGAIQDQVDQQHVLNGCCQRLRDADHAKPVRAVVSAAGAAEDHAPPPVLLPAGAVVKVSAAQPDAEVVVNVTSFDGLHSHVYAVHVLWQPGDRLCAPGERTACYNASGLPTLCKSQTYYPVDYMHGYTTCQGGTSPLAPQSFELRTRGQLKREEERSRGDASGSEFAYDLLRLVGFFDLRDSH